MRTLPVFLIASALLVGAPLAFAEDVTISPEVGTKFHNEIQAKKYQSHKYDGDLAVGTVVPGDVEYYDVPEDIIVANPALKRDRYVYLNDHIYIVNLVEGLLRSSVEVARERPNEYHRLGARQNTPFLEQSPAGGLSREGSRPLL